jgi:hypothetical protein
MRIIATRWRVGAPEPSENNFFEKDQMIRMEATTRIELVYTVLQTVA